MTSEPKRLQIISFAVLLLAVFVVVAFMFRPFVNILALSFILAILFRPVYRAVLKRIKSPSLASLAVVLLMIGIVVVPLVFFGQLLYGELVNVYQQFRSGALVLSRDQIVASVPPQFQTVIEQFSRDINGLVSNFTSQAFQTISGFLSNVAAFFLAVFILVFSVYYLLRDGDRLKQVVMDISPISSNQEERLFERIVSAVNGVVKGAFLIALVQGVVATIGFYIFNVPQPLLWGMFTVIAALVPNIGTSLSLVPAIVYLVLVGQVPQAIGLAIWSALAVGLIDNALSPKLIGSAVRLHPVLVLLSVIGGLQVFGILGFLLGPIVMSVFVALLDMYRTDFKDYLAR
jgi:predicted PurR-regulated permease PerM